MACFHRFGVNGSLFFSPKFHCVESHENICVRLACRDCGGFHRCTSTGVWLACGRCAHPCGLAGPAVVAAAVPQPLRHRHLQRPCLLLGPLRIRIPILLLLASILRLLPHWLRLLRLDRAAALPPVTAASYLAITNRSNTSEALKRGLTIARQNRPGAGSR